MFLLVRNFFGFFGTKVICSGFFAFFLPRGNFNSDAFSTFFCVGMFFFILIDLIVCIIIRYRYYVFADGYSALWLSIKLSV